MFHILRKRGSAWAGSPEWVNVLGVTDESTFDTTESKNYETFYKYAASANAIITTVRVYCSGSCNVHVAIYEYLGTVGNYLGGNNVGVACVEGWNDIPIPATAVTNGTSYYIGVIADQDVRKIKATAAGQYYRLTRSVAYAGHVWIYASPSTSATEWNGAVEAGYYVGQNTLYPAYTAWNPSDKHSGLTLSNFNLTMVHGKADHAFYGIRSALGVSSGKHYWELTYVEDSSGLGGDHACVGVANSTFPEDDGSMLGDDTNSWSYRKSDGQKYTNNSGAAYGATFAKNDIISIALDMGAGKIWFAKNGTWQASGDPAAGTNEAFSGISGTVYAALTPYIKSSSWKANFGAAAFSYTVPTGFRRGLYA